MKRIVFASATFVVAIIVLQLFVFSSFKNINADTDYFDAFNRNYKIFAVNTPENISFAGERVPVEKFYVKESLDRELLVNTYWQSNALLLFKRANRWFPVIEPILEKNGVPDDFKYLAVIESGFVNVVSPAGAAGFWQFMKKTGREYGLEINSEIDERYNLEKSTEAACKYFNKVYKKYGNWTLSAAAFNMGRAGLNRKIEQQREKDYYELYLNSETSRYVYRILAIKHLFSNPSRHGFFLRDKDMYPCIPTYIVEVDTSVGSLVDFAFEHNINYKILKNFNPWLRKSSLENLEQKTYSIKIPKSVYYDSLVNFEGNVANDSDSVDCIPAN